MLQLAHICWALRHCVIAEPAPAQTQDQDATAAAAAVRAADAETTPLKPDSSARESLLTLCCGVVRSRNCSSCTAALLLPWTPFAAAVVAEEKVTLEVSLRRKLLRANTVSKFAIANLLRVLRVLKIARSILLNNFPDPFQVSSGPARWQSHSKQNGALQHRSAPHVPMQVIDQVVVSQVRQTVMDSLRIFLKVREECSATEVQPPRRAWQRRSITSRTLTSH